jgi:hypothetical protein
LRADYASVDFLSTVPKVKLMRILRYLIDYLYEIGLCFYAELDPKIIRNELQLIFVGFSGRQLPATLLRKAVPRRVCRACGKFPI